MNQDGEFENFVVVAMVQALIGAIADEVVAVSVRVVERNESICMMILALEETELLAELVDEVVSDLDALFGGSVFVDTAISVGSDVLAWEGTKHRQVFLRHVVRS